jgi:hypothetical protein
VLGKRPLFLRLSEEGLEIAVEAVEEFVHVHDVVDANGFTWRFSFGFNFDDLALVFDAQLSEGRPGLGRVAIANQRGDEISGLTIDTLDNHHPDVGFAGQNMHVVRTKRPMADCTTIHSLQNNAFDLSFRGIHGEGSL